MTQRILNPALQRQYFGRGVGKSFVGFQITGDKEVIRTLGRLGPVVGRRILTKALRRGGMEVVRAARRNLLAGQAGRGGTPTGALAASLGVRVRIYPHSGTAVAVIGARRGKKYRDRVRLLHLVEFGHKQVVWGKATGGRVPEHPFLTPAWESTAGHAMDIAMGVLRNDVRQAAAKMGVRFA